MKAEEFKQWLRDGAPLDDDGEEKSVPANVIVAKGEVRITLDDGTVVIQSSPAVEESLQALEADLEGLRATFDAHVHPTSSGPTGPSTTSAVSRLGQAAKDAGKAVFGAAKAASEFGDAMKKTSKAFDPKTHWEDGTRRK